MVVKISSILYRDKIDSDYAMPEYFVLFSIILMGVVLRFWGLGNVGLHGDEETMAMPALKILESGLPLLPSDMLYPRSVGQLYLMAASVWVFGLSEWALRFPSAVTGSIAIIIAFFLGKKLLPVRMNLLFVLMIALLPSMIAISQTARMYIFFSTFVMLFVVMVFRWEDKKTFGSLASAFIVLLIALQFHKLAIFTSLLFLYPGIAKESGKLFRQGSVALIGAGVAYMILDHWMGLQYSNIYSTAGDSEGNNFFQPFMYLLGTHPVMLGISSILLIVIIVFLYYEKTIRSSAYTFSVILLFLSIASCIVSYYHVGLILFGGGTVIYLRSGGRKALLFILIFAVTLLFAYQFYFLHQSDLFPGIRKLLRALNGTPSVWPYLRLACYFPVGAVLYGFIFMFAIYRLAMGEKIPDHFMFFVISVWLPLFIMGFFRWDVAPRYTYGFVPFLILCCVAGISYLLSIWKPMSDRNSTRYQIALYPLIIIAFINPVELERNINISYEDFHYLSGHRGADHKGAAEYIKNLDLKPGDILIAEDVLQQTYYLGKVDYWLRSIDDAKSFIREKDNKLIDIYTSTPLIGSGDELEKVLNNRKSSNVYIIGSGETRKNRKRFLGNNILKTIENNNPKIIYSGRDHETKIWYFSGAKNE